MVEAWLVGLGLLVGVPWLEERWTRHRRHKDAPAPDASECLRRWHERVRMR